MLAVLHSRRRHSTQFHSNEMIEKELHGFLQMVSAPTSTF